MLTPVRGVVLALAGLSLAACNVHPGSAAVVDGRSISMRTLDKTAEAYCALTAEAAQQQGVSTVSGSQVRRQAIVGLVSVSVARDLARKEGLTVERTSYELTPAQRKQLAKAFPDKDADGLGRAVEDSQEVSAIAIALAEKQTNQQATAENEEQFAELGQKAIIAAFKDSDVSFAPRFGLDSSGRPRNDTGSVSVTPVDLEAPVDEELPRSLRCS